MLYLGPVTEGGLSRCRRPLKPLELQLLGYDIPLAPRPLARALVGEVRSMPVALQAWFGLLLAILAVGVVAAIVAIPPGWEVFGTKPSFEWGLMIIGYVFFAVMTSGLCLASSLGTVFGIERFRPFEKRHAILAVLSLTTAFLIIALDLHYPVRMVFGAVLVPSPSSPMWWMGVFYGLYLVVLLVEVWSMFTDHPKIHQYACTAAAVVAILAPATLGAVFGVIGRQGLLARRVHPDPDGGLGLPRGHRAALRSSSTSSTASGSPTGSTRRRSRCRRPGC